jgi:hypothetical protein
MLWKVAWSPSLLFRVLGLIGIKYPEQQIVMNAMNSVRHGLDAVFAVILRHGNLISPGGWGQQSPHSSISEITVAS